MAILVVALALVAAYLVYHCFHMFTVSLEEMKACEEDGDCAPVGCFCWCSGGGFSYEEIVNERYVDAWYLQQGCDPPVMCLEEKCPPIRAICRDNMCTVEGPFIDTFTFQEEDI